MKKILWFRRDLRVHDSMLLAQEGEVLPLFIFDKHILESLDKNDRRVDFIFKALIKLKADLKDIGLDLALFYGTPEDVFTYLAKQGFHDVYASIDYDAYATQRDAKVAQILTFHPLNDTYIFEPNEVLKKNGSPYLVFTPYFLTCKQIYTKFHALSYTKASHSLASFTYNALLSCHNNTISPLHVSMESIGFKALHVSYPSARERLETFAPKLDEYEKNRDYLFLDATSHLSVDLRFGTLSIREVLRYLSYQKQQGKKTEPFFRQLIFREFYAYLLYHFPSLGWKNYKYATPIAIQEQYYEAFCTAQTGYPLIDAAINQLLQTGHMHNRARMIVGSFFTKHLCLPWQMGEAFFAKHLLDYDAASNILSWQWCAGTGIDPQPYFRIFNPYTQAKKFDENVSYIKHWLPQLSSFSTKELCSEDFLAKLALHNYPMPIVRHAQARQNFLDAFKHANTPL